MVMIGGYVTMVGQFQAEDSRKLKYKIGHNGTRRYHSCKWYSSLHVQRNVHKAFSSISFPFFFYFNLAFIQVYFETYLVFRPKKWPMFNFTRYEHWLSLPFLSVWSLSFHQRKKKLSHELWWNFFPLDMQKKQKCFPWSASTLKSITIIT